MAVRAFTSAIATGIVGPNRSAITTCVVATPRALDARAIAATIIYASTRASVV